MSQLPPDMKNFRAKSSCNWIILILSAISLVVAFTLIAHMKEQLHQARLDQIRSAHQQCTEL